MKQTSRRLARRAGTAAEAETIAIVCEGTKTEHLYFTGVRREFRLSTARVHIVGTGTDPVWVVKEAITLRPNFDHAWAVFDVEAPKPHARLAQALRLSEQHGIQCAVSNPCFEVWLLLHFKYHTAYLDNTGARHQLRQCPCGYDEKGFDFAAIWPRHRRAIDFATKLDARQRIDHPAIARRNPWTSVHILVEQLLTLAVPGINR